MSTLKIEVKQMLCKNKSLYQAISLALLSLAAGCSTMRSKSSMQDNAFQCPVVVRNVGSVKGDAESIVELSKKFEERLLTIREYLEEIAEKDIVREGWLGQKHADIAGKYRSQLQEQGRYKTLDFHSYLNHLDTTINCLELLSKSMGEDITFIKYDEIPREGIIPSE